MASLLRGPRGLAPSRREGRVDRGELRRTPPIGRCSGSGRGLPVDRLSAERFGEHRREDVRGRVAEVGDDSDTRRPGGAPVERACPATVAARAWVPRGWRGAEGSRG